MEKFLQSKKGILIASLISTALWGSAFPVVKIGYDLLGIETQDIYSKIYFAGLRFFIASMMVFLIHRLIYKKPIKMDRSNLKPILLLGILQTAVQYFFFYIGVANTSGIKSSILQSGNTFFTVILAHFIFEDDRLNSRKTMSLLIGFLGVIVVNLGKDFDLNFKFIGEGFLIISAILSAFANIFAKKISSIEPNPFTVSGGQMLFGSLLMLLVGKLGLAGAGLDFGFKSFLLLIYAAFISAAAFTLWYMLIKYNSPGKISIYRLFIPIFGSFFSILALPGEKFTLNLFIGLMLVVGGIMILNTDSKKA